MRNKKVIGIIVLLLASISILGCISDKSSQSEKDKEEPPVTTAIPTVAPQETPLTAPYVEDCQKPSSNIYGGINRNENNPPDGTTIDDDLTKYYGRPTATGICGTYRYISGWWFNDEEVGRLPFRSIVYGESPYVTDEGSGPQEPIAPVPENSTLILTAFGIITIITLKKYKQ